MDGILERDFVLNGVDSQTDWHRKTVCLGRAIMREDMPEVIRENVRDAKGNPLEIDGEPWFYLATADDGKAIAKPFCGGSFSVFDSWQGFDWIAEILAGTEYRIKRAGMLFNRSRWFYSVELTELNRIARPGTVLNLNIANGLDGSLSRGAELSETTVVCHNTLNLSRLNGQRLFQVKNTKNATARMESLQAEIEKACGMAAVWRAAMETMQKTPCQVQTAREIYTGAIAEDETEKLTTTARNKVEGLLGLFQRGDGNRGETMADVLNGFTQYGTRGFETSKKDIFTRLESSEFGGMADKKAEFARGLMENNGESFRDRGAKLLAAAN